MTVKIEIEGDSEGAVALALLSMVAQAEGKMDASGQIRQADREWILDTFAECMLAVEGVRLFADDDEDEDEDEDDDDDDDDDEEDDEDDEDELDDDEEDEEEEPPAPPPR